MHSVQIVVLVVRYFVDTRKIIKAIAKYSVQDLHVSVVELHLIIQWCDHDIIVSVMFFEKFMNPQKNIFLITEICFFSLSDWLKLARSNKTPVLFNESIFLR